MSLPAPVIDRLFQKMMAVYGASWDRSLGAAPLGDVKSTWGDQLSGFTKRLEDIAWALDNLPDRPPNIIEFKRLCRAAPVPEVPRLPEPKADPKRVAAELAKLAPIKQTTARYDHKEWARRIIRQHEDGGVVSAIRLRFAREALKSNSTLEE